MGKTRKTLIALAAVGLFAAGCSDPGATGSSSSSGQTATWADETAKLDGVSLTIWAAQNSNTVAKKTADDFSAKTGAKINIVTVPDPYEQSVQTKVASGDKPDLAFWQPTASELTAINAKTNLQTLDGAPFIAKYGISSTPKNFDEMIADARKIKGKGGTPFYEMGGEKWATQWWVQVQLADAAKQGLWDKVNKGQEKFTDPTILDAIKKYKSLVDEGLFNKNITSATFADQGKALLAGDAAMVIQVNTFFSQLQAQSTTDELNKKIGFFPISPSANVGTFIPDQSNALIAFKTGDAKREAAARQFLTYWLGSGYAEFVKNTNTVSIEDGVDTPATVPTALSANADSIGDSVGSMQVSAIVNPDLYLNLANMLAGQQTPEKVAETTQAQFAQLAQAIGASGF